MIPSAIRGIVGVNNCLGQEGSERTGGNFWHLIAHLVRGQPDFLERDRSPSSGGEIADAVGELRHVSPPSTLIFVSPEGLANCRLDDAVRRQYIVNQAEVGGRDEYLQLVG